MTTSNDSSDPARPHGGGADPAAPGSGTVEHVIRRLHAAANSERAPDHLRAALAAQERDAMAGTTRRSAPRSARKGLARSGARRPAQPPGPEALVLPEAVLGAESETRSGDVTATGPVGPGVARAGRSGALSEPIVVDNDDSPQTDSAAAWASNGAQASRRRKRQVQMRAMAVPAILLVVIVGMAVFRSNGSSAGPTVRQVASLATLSPAEPAPQPLTGATPPRLSLSVQRVHFPDWSARGWRATGARQDELQGRRVSTVFYARGVEELAFSIVTAPVLTDIGRSVDAHDFFHLHGRNYVVWTVSNHTAMLSGRSLSSRQLWNLAQSTLPG